MSKEGLVCRSSSTAQGPRPRTRQAARDFKVITYIFLGGGVEGSPNRPSVKSRFEKYVCVSCGRRANARRSPPIV